MCAVEEELSSKESKHCYVVISYSGRSKSFQSISNHSQVCGIDIKRIPSCVVQGGVAYFDEYWMATDTLTNALRHEVFPNPIRRPSENRGVIQLNVEVIFCTKRSLLIFFLLSRYKCGRNEDEDSTVWHSEILQDARDCYSFGRKLDRLVFIVLKRRK